jgi:RecB family exonuclease
MRDEYGWLGIALGALFRLHPNDPPLDRPAIAERIERIEAVASRVSERADTMSTAVAAISEKMGQ